jgi:hypothetical protein
MGGSLCLRRGHGIVIAQPDDPRWHPLTQIKARAAVETIMIREFTR